MTDTPVSPEAAGVARADDAGGQGPGRRPIIDPLTVDHAFTARGLLIDPDLDLTEGEKAHLVAVMWGHR